MYGRPGTDEAYLHPEGSSSSARQLYLFKTEWPIQLRGFCPDFSVLIKDTNMTNLTVGTALLQHLQSRLQGLLAI